MESFNDYVYEIAYKIEETKEDFILTNISTFCGTDYEISKYPISKEIIKRALICFMDEHSEEYHILLKASYERVNTESEE